jgi:hypothetical protein
MAEDERGWLGRRLDNARQGIEENFWWLVAFAIGAAAWAWLRDGDVPA